jgi:hypothetical protein
MKMQQLLYKLETAWVDFNRSYFGLTNDLMHVPGVTPGWSVKDILAHVTVWDAETLKALPMILEGRQPIPDLRAYGGLDAFNALMTEQNRHIPLPEILRQLDETHCQLLHYVESAPLDQIERETPFRQRLRMDTYSHYPEHARSIRLWRELL